MCCTEDTLCYQPHDCYNSFEISTPMLPNVPCLSFQLLPASLNKPLTAGSIHQAELIRHYWNKVKPSIHEPTRKKTNTKNKHNMVLSISYRDSTHSFDVCLSHCNANRNEEVTEGKTKGLGCVKRDSDALFTPFLLKLDCPKLKDQKGTAQ